MYVARQEAGETQNHIEAMAGKAYMSREKADNLINRYERIMAGINSFINYIRNKQGKGRKK